MQPGQRRSRFDIAQRLVDGVVRADQEIGADLRQLLGGGEHQLAHALPVAAVDAGSVVGEGGRMHRDLGMRMGPSENGGTFHADGPIAKRRTFGGAAHDTDMLGHDGRVHDWGAGKCTYSADCHHRFLPTVPLEGQLHLTTSSLAPASVIPAKAGIQGRRPRRSPWIPAFAGMTAKKAVPLSHLRSPCTEGQAGWGGRRVLPPASCRFI